MTQELTTTNAMSLVLQAEKFNSIAKTFADSGLFTDVKGQAQCFVKIMAGAEMGIPPFTAMNSFHIIKGKTTMTANAIAARVKSSKRYDYRVIEKSPIRCTIDFFEHGQKVHSETWDSDRARKAGTQNMDRFPDAMLFARALTAGARAVCPDIVGQYYTPEEMGAPVDEEGNYVDSTARVVEPTKAQPAKATVEIVGDHGIEFPNAPTIVRTDADVLAELRPIYGEVAAQVKAIGQEPCKPPKNPTPAQVQDCIDQMRKALAEFDNMGKADPVLEAAQQLGGVVQPA